MVTPSHLQFLSAVILAFAWSIVSWPLLTRLTATWLRLPLISALVLTPLLIEKQSIMLRAAACFVAVELWFKLVDYYGQFHGRRAMDRSFASFAKFLIPFPVLFVRFRAIERKPHWDGRRLMMTIVALGLFLSGFLQLWLLKQVPLVRSSFLVDHTLKFICFVITIEALSRFLKGVERLAGFRIRPIIDSAYQSKTVGEFWSRYNTRVHSWMEHNVFRALAARKMPIRGVFLTFILSGMLHEVAFAIATSRLDGYQFAFFSLQAPAVLLLHWLDRRWEGSRMGQLALRAISIVWMWATSMLFFNGMHRVFPFVYSSESWLP
jgi:hypothetical protein